MISEVIGHRRGYARPAWAPRSLTCSASRRKAGRKLVWGQTKIIINLKPMELGEQASFGFSQYTHPLAECGLVLAVTVQPLY